MAALADLSDLVNRATGGNSGTPEMVNFLKVDRVAGAAPVAPVAGRFNHLWLYDGQPGAGVAPGAVAAPTRATAGALAQVNPGGSRQKWMTYWWAACTSAGTLTLCDRLLHISGLSGTSTSAQTVGGTLSRYAAAGTCLGNEIWLDVYTQIGVTSTTFTVSYQNQANATKTSPAISIGNTGLREAQRSIPVPLASGDSGVLAVNSVTLAATTGTVGDFGVTVRRPLAALGFASAGVAQMSSLLDQPAEILTDACLDLVWFSNSTTVPLVMGGIHMIEA